MNIDFKLPELGENIHSGDVVSVLVHEGDQIAANDGVFELETDKAVVEIPCPYAGRIAKLLVKKGDTIKVGQVVLSIASGDEAKEPPAPVAAPSPTPQAAPVAAAKPQPAPAAPSAPAAPAAQDRPGPIPAGPVVRRMAREQGIDLSTVAGSGKHGRITPEDIAAATIGRTSESVAESKPAAQTSAGSSASLARRTSMTQPANAGVQLTDGDTRDAWGPVRVEKLSRIRRTIAEQMVRSATTIPHVTNFDDADVTELEGLRKGVPAGQLGQNVKLTMMPFVMARWRWPCDGTPW